MTSSLNFASKRSRYFGGQRNIDPPFRVNPNPIFDIFDVVDRTESGVAQLQGQILKKAREEV